MKDVVKAISELRQEFSLDLLLKVSGMAKSVYFYHTEVALQPDKYTVEKEEISAIFKEHNGNYGYPRITDEMHNRGYAINHKTVYKLMIELKLKCKARPKRKYNSYKGKVGHTAPNILNRNFKATKPLQKWTTDISMIKICDQWLYLSPIIDMYNGEVLSYAISDSPNMRLIHKMLDGISKKYTSLNGLIMHSDQGWHYQHHSYCARLKAMGITQSMSRKGNCLDNAMVESFFAVLKSEFLYRRTFTSVEEFLTELDKYFYYYNNKRIKSRLNGMSPVQYRISNNL